MVLLFLFTLYLLKVKIASPFSKFFACAHRRRGIKKEPARVRGLSLCLFSLLGFSITYWPDR